MKKEKERLEKISEERERKNKEQDEKAEKWKRDIWMDVLAILNSL
jgi:hypothetical protein